jgi:hypothetical protein
MQYVLLVLTLIIGFCISLRILLILFGLFVLLILFLSLCSLAIAFLGSVTGRPAPFRSSCISVLRSDGSFDTEGEAHRAFSYLGRTK